MFKILLLCLFFITSAADAQTVSAPSFTQQQQELIKSIEAYFNGFQTIKSKFYQTSDNGAVAQGNFYVLKPNKMRLEYDPPHPVEVVADGYYLIFHDKKLEQVTYLDLDDNPAAMILKENFSFEKEGLTITDFVVESGVISVSVTKKSQPTAGKITLIFKDKPLSLKQWRVTDAQQITTLVTLNDMETNVKLDKALFKFKDPKKKLRPGDVPRHR